MGHDVSGEMVHRFGVRAVFERAFGWLLPAVVQIEHVDKEPHATVLAVFDETRFRVCVVLAVGDGSRTRLAFHLSVVHVYFVAGEYSITIRALEKFLGADVFCEEGNHTATQLALFCRVPSTVRCKDTSSDFIAALARARPLTASVTDVVVELAKSHVALFAHFARAREPPVAWFPALVSL